MKIELIDLGKATVETKQVLEGSTFDSIYSPTGVDGKP